MFLPLFYHYVGLMPYYTIVGKYLTPMERSESDSRPNYCLYDTVRPPAYDEPYVQRLLYIPGFKCTAPGEACTFSASGADILPPVVSGRITSKFFAFTYGTVEVRAKLPQGDWLYPEILLEPFLKKYGSQNFASGVLKIATARGNSELYNDNSDYSNKVLYGGPIMNFGCRNRLLTRKVLLGGKQWGDDFHVYSLRWEPDRITLSVDGEEWSRVDPTANGLAGLLPQSCKQVPRALLDLGSKLAPFDDYFYLTFGVAAGGVTEFPAGSITKNNHPKPWNNHNPKAKMHFWQDINAWMQTWTQPALLVDYVKVVAL